jgi:hypothetical protein
MSGFTEWCGSEGASSLAGTEWSQWLRDNWLPDGPPVSVIEGFSGVGKSRLARWLTRESDLPAVMVQIAEGGLGLDDTLVELAVALDDLGFPAMSMREDGNLLKGLEEVLRRPVLLVIDNFEHALDTATGLPSSQFWHFIIGVSNRYSYEGRLLLLTSRALPEGLWQETVAVKTLMPPDEDVAVNILNQLLADKHREDEIPVERRRDVVQWLGRNPRAIQALIACLAEDALEDLIDLEPDAWEMRGEIVSDKLVEQLELRFLSRTLERLDTSGLMLLECLSVYRKPFTRDAIDRVGSQLAQARTELTQSFILDRHRTKYSLNRVAQQLALARLVVNQQRLTAAHRFAADHFVRHFRAKGGYSAADKGMEFVEARYHLLLLGREREFEEIASQFRRGLLLSYGNSTQAPTDLRKRRELIPTLLAALGNEDEGYPQIRYLLARLLVQRNYPGDAILALRQITAVTKESVEPGAWSLRQQLAWEQAGRVGLQAATNQALERLQPISLTPIYYRSAKLLATGGHIQESLTQLTEGMETCRTNRDVFSLYQLTAAILFLQGRGVESYSKLLDFYMRYGSKGGNIKRIFEQAMSIMLAIKDTAALESLVRMALDEGMDFVPPLGRLLILFANGRYADAGKIEPPLEPYIAFDIQLAFGYLCSGRQRDALDSIRNVQPISSGSAWIDALVMHCNGLDALACNALERVSDRQIAVDQLPRELITMWASPTDPLGVSPSFSFPTLPTELTGLERDISSISRNLELDDLLTQIRFPRIAPPPADMAAEQVLTEPAAVDVGPGLNLTIAPHIVTMATAEGGIGMTGDRYEVGQAGAVGPHSTAHDIQFTQVWNRLAADTNLSALADDLGKLRTALRERANEPGEDLALAEVSQAQLAATEGDGPRALSHLAKAGQWALGIATAIGANLAAAAIKSALGL